VGKSSLVKSGFGYDDEILTNSLMRFITVKERLQHRHRPGWRKHLPGGSWKNQSLSRVTLDNIRMLATIQNALYLSEILIQKGYEAEVFSSFVLDKVARHYSAPKVQKAMNEGKICFLSGGTGNPYFTTDTAAGIESHRAQAGYCFQSTPKWMVSTPPIR
jgi:uridylate kinase